MGDDTQNIVATVRVCVQVGPDDFNTYRHSKVFPYSATIQEIIKWAESIGLRNVNICDIVLSRHEQ